MRASESTRHATPPLLWSSNNSRQERMGGNASHACRFLRFDTLSSQTSRIGRSPPGQALSQKAHNCQLEYQSNERNATWLSVRRPTEAALLLLLSDDELQCPVL